MRERKPRRQLLVRGSASLCPPGGLRGCWRPGTRWSHTRSRDTLRYLQSWTNNVGLLEFCPNQRLAREVQLAPVQNRAYSVKVFSQLRFRGRGLLQANGLLVRGHGLVVALQLFERMRQTCEHLNAIVRGQF